MLRAQPPCYGLSLHVTGSASCYGLSLHVTGSASCCWLIFFLKKKFNSGKKNLWKIEPATWPWASTVVQKCKCLAFRVMLRAQPHVAPSIFWRDIFFFRGVLEPWVSKMSLSEHNGIEWARWDWVSTMGLSEHGEAEPARWVWVSNIGPEGNDYKIQPQKFQKINQKPQEIPPKA